MKRTVVIMLIVALIVVLAAGCTKNDNSGGAVKDNTSSKRAAAQVIEPDQLISKEEAEELIGAAVAEVQKSEQEVVGMKQCVYEFSGEAEDRLLQVSLNQQAFMKNPNPGVTPKYLFESIKDNFVEELVAVDGIGDEAFFAVPGIHILKGDYYITISVGLFSSETNKDMLKTAGTKAVKNLELLTNK